MPTSISIQYNQITQLLYGTHIGYHKEVNKLQTFEILSNHLFSNNLNPIHSIKPNAGWTGIPYTFFESIAIELK